MQATSENDPFPVIKHLLITGADDHSLAGSVAIIKVSDHQHQCLTGDYDLEIRRVVLTLRLLV